MKFKLSKYIIPSVISMVLVGTYTNIDGFFIGNVTGDDGLAAINIVWPIVAFITSLGTGIGVGGSILLNRFRGAKDNCSAENVKKTMLFLLFAIGLIASLLFFLIYKPLLLLMGAEGEVLKYSSDYAKIISIGAVFQVAGSGLVAILRNEQKTYFSMACCIVGLIVHIILDFILVKKYTLAGVAFSTVISQFVIMVMCLLSIRTKNKAYINKKYFCPILKSSSSPLGINFVPSVVLLLTNWFALKCGGTAAVSAYAVMSYAVYTFDYIFQGVCDGVQPVISYSSGAGDKAQENRALKAAGIILFVSSALFIICTPLLIDIMPKLFSVSNKAEQMMKYGFIIYAFAYPFKAGVKLIGSYYYAIGKSRISNLLIYSDPIVFTPLMLCILSNIAGINGVWLSMTFSQVFVLILGALSFKMKSINDKQQAHI